MSAFFVILLYFLMVNLLGFAMMGFDKWKAKKNLWRIPEATLFVIAVIGGSVGSILGMYSFHHKTRKRYFAYGMPAILCIQLFLLFLLYKAPLTFIFM